MKCNFWRPSTGKSFSEALILASYDKRLSYCGLVDARISASEKDLPIQGPGIILLKIRLKNSLTFRQNIE